MPASTSSPGSVPGNTLDSLWNTRYVSGKTNGITALTLALMDDLERITVGVEYIGGIVSRIVFQSCAGRNVVPGTSGHWSLVEFSDLVFIFGHETPVNGCWIRLPLLYPEKRLFAVTKSPQIGMTVFALVRHEEFDIERLQCRLIKGQRTFDIADSQNDVVEHRSPPQITSVSNGLFAIGYCMDRKRRYVHTLSMDGLDIFNSDEAQGLAQIR